MRNVSILVSFPPADHSHPFPRLSIDERFALCRSVGEECIQEDELRNLLLKKPSPPVCYDGFEPSGRVHIAQVGPMPPF